jgi:uncharacterized membrane protein YgcG
MGTVVDRREVRGMSGIRKLLALGVNMLAALMLFPLLLSPSPASASTLTDCLAQQHVCVASDGRGLISQSQEADLERQIGGDPIYLVVAAPGSAGYDSAMNKIISALNGHPQFTVGFLDSQQKHFGAYNKGMLPSGGAAGIATSVVKQHQADQDIFAALTDFITDVQREASTGAGPGPDGAAASAPSHALRNVLIVVGVVAVVAALGIFFIARPVRQRRQQELKEAKLAAQDDLIALSTRLTDQDTDVAIRDNPEAAQEQTAALGAYERGTAALDAARRPQDMGAVSRAIAEGQYHLASAEALAAGQPRPDRRPPCFFDPRHGMSVTDAYWTPPDGGPGRLVPVCSADAHKLERGIEPEMRKVEVHGTPVNYVNAGFAPAYWGGYGFGPGLFTGFLLGEVLSPPVVYADGYPGGGDYGGGDFGGSNGGDFGGGDFGGGDYGGGDFGGGDFGGGDFGGGGDFS